MTKDISYYTEVLSRIETESTFERLKAFRVNQVATGGNAPRFLVFRVLNRFLQSLMDSAKHFPSCGARTYSVSFANSIACDSVLKLRTASTGPKISSRHAVLSAACAAPRAQVLEPLPGCDDRRLPTDNRPARIVFGWISGPVSSWWASRAALKSSYSRDRVEWTHPMALKARAAKTRLGWAGLDGG